KDATLQVERVAFVGDALRPAAGRGLSASGLPRPFLRDLLSFDDVRSRGLSAYSRRGLSAYSHCRIPPFIVYFLIRTSIRPISSPLVRWNLSLRRALKELTGDFRTRAIGPAMPIFGAFFVG